MFAIDQCFKLMFMFSQFKSYIFLNNIYNSVSILWQNLLTAILYFWKIICLTSTTAQCSDKFKILFIL